MSYFIIHRYFAVLRWYKITQREQGDQAEVFQQFDKTFESSLRAFQKKHKFAWSDLYFARDTPRDTIWRCELFPSYKGTRDAGLNNFDPVIFDHVYDVLMPKLETSLGFGGILFSHGAEADDVIAVVRKHLGDEEKCLILTNDHDYLQMLNENTIIVNAKDEPVSKKYSAEILEHFLVYKIIKGDVSDNIPSIGKKIGEKTAYKLALDPVSLKAKMASDVKIASQYELNNQLINFDCIPKLIKDNIIEIFDIKRCAPTET